MEQYIPGQRWISEMEPELGLGIVTKTENRRVFIHFPAGECIRQYATETAPIKRVRFRPGDTVVDKDGNQFTVTTVDEQNGLFFYNGKEINLPETDLCDTIAFTTPEERLLGRQTDPSSFFDLRYQTHSYRNTLFRSPVRGFLGGRIDLLDHQLYIAGEVASRPLPRVLLADEVGLGKTIEACLILHRLLLTGRINRALILVPEHLLHQWFVELLRRFNLHFRIFDEEYCQSITEHQPEVNPFFDDQLILTHLPFLTENDDRPKQIAEGNWDMVIVDEAHHLKAGTPYYQLIKSICSVTPGVLLLTATPEQLGVHSHFDRLQLLDPARYPDFFKFEKESADYHFLATLINSLLNCEKPDRKSIEKLCLLLEQDLKHIENKITNFNPDAKESIAFIHDILDRYGTGRVLFRNTRRTMRNFPKRFVHLNPLNGNTQQLEQIRSEFTQDTASSIESIQYNYESDPRLSWLTDYIRTHPEEKILLICRHIDKTHAIQNALRAMANIKSALFHEEMTIIQRDRNAAWFSEKDGARILICSEIGSEGRNFQFASHLVLFDLPLNPELLEQRIGRLDRIGQTSDMHIHIPYLIGSPQEILVKWYHEGLSAFEKNVPGVYKISETFQKDLLSTAGNASIGSEKIEKLIDETRLFRDQNSEQLEKGRNRLLELNSCRHDVAKVIIEQIQEMDQSSNLENYLMILLDFLGIHAEEISSRLYQFYPANLRVEGIPGFRENGMVVTFNRNKAIKRDDIHFMTWDHPMVSGAMEVITGFEHGNSAVAIVKLIEEEYILESVFILECVSPPRLNVDRFLPPTPIHMILNPEMKNCTAQYENILSKTKINNDSKSTFFDLHHDQETVTQMMNVSLNEAKASGEEIKNESLDICQKIMGAEISRLKALQKKNPGIKDVEIEMLQDEMDTLTKTISSAQIRLDALRIIWNGKSSEQ